MKKSTQTITILLLIIVLCVIAALAYISFGASEISQGTPIPKYSIEKSALLVVDIQEATTGIKSKNEYYIANSEALINTINRLVKAAYFHNIPVIYVKNEITDAFVNLINNSMAKGSVGAQFDKRLQLVTDNIIAKEKQDAFSNYKLDSILNQHKVNKLYIVGLDAAFCINSTIKAASNREYNICIITDALLSTTEELKENMLNDFTDRNVKLVSSKEFIEKLNEDQFFYDK